MNIAVIGTGYVGLVAGTCFAEMGNRVICCDCAKEKIDALRKGIVPIYEPGLADYVKRNAAEQRLIFTTDLKRAVRESQIIFIAVGTPGKDDGDVDMSFVYGVARDIGRAMNGEKIIVDKSTVPVGTAHAVRDIIAKETRHKFHVVSNPEFMKEGAAVEDFMKPDRIVIGSDDDQAAHLMKELYAPFVRTGNPILVMDTRSAEMTKYAANAMLAARVSFMNEIANLCERLGADVDAVRVGIGTDRRIGPSFLFPGIGYGGSCFPKDVQGVLQMARQVKYDARITRAVHEVNEAQKLLLFHKVLAHFGKGGGGSQPVQGSARKSKTHKPKTRPALEGKRFAVWGLAFKPCTDDMREAPSIAIITKLLEHGARVAAFDPEAMPNARKIFGDRLHCVHTQYDALDDADALLVLTEWHEFRNPDFARIKNRLRQPVIFDGRNIYTPAKMKELGFTYYSMGRAAVRSESAGNVKL
jgi:UDPglucose 6-dehydrogenase